MAFASINIRSVYSEKVRLAIGWLGGIYGKGMASSQGACLLLKGVKSMSTLFCHTQINTNNLTRSTSKTCPPEPEEP